MSNTMIQVVKKEDGLFYKIYPDGKEEILSNENRKDDVQRLMNMTDEEAYQNALDDPDNQPLTEEQIANLKPVYSPKPIRKKLHMNQEEFSKVFKIPLGTLRDWEQEKSIPDATARAYLEVIEKNPDLVMRSLS